MRFRLTLDGESFEVHVARTDEGTRVEVDGRSVEATVRPAGEGWRLSATNLSGRFVLARGEVRFEAQRLPAALEQLRLTALGEESGNAGAERDVKPPMPGRILSVRAARGAVVRKGQTVVVLEAMKMQNEIVAPRDGTVREILVREGDVVEAGEVLLVLE